jgi:hypothetical protein
MSPHDKPLVWLKGEVKTPPLSDVARVEAGFLLRRLQRGDLLGVAGIEADAHDWARLS